MKAGWLIGAGILASLVYCAVVIAIIGFMGWVIVKVMVHFGIV